jgi:hypothetical protein
LPVSFLSILAPSLPVVLSVAFLPTRGAFKSQSSLFIFEESIFWPSISENFNYARVGENSSMFLVMSLSPMEIDLPNLPLSSPLD